MRIAVNSLVVAALSVLETSSARAEDAGLVSTADRPPPEARHFQLSLEAAGGSDGPLGHLGGALLAGQDWWQLGLGYGRHLDSSKPDRYGVLGRLRLLRRGPASLWAAAAGSWGYRSTMRQYARPGYDMQTLNVWWDPATRVSAGLAGQYKVGRFQLSIEAGAGYNVNKPNCTVSPPDVPCDAPQVKAAYGDLAPFEPGRFTPYVMAGLGMDLLSYRDSGRGEDAGGGSSPGGLATERPQDPRATEGFVTPTALTQPRGSVTITSRMLVLEEVTYAFSDRWQASVGGGFIPQDEGDAMRILTTSAKVQLLREGRLRLAVAGGMLYRSDRSNIDALAGLGPVATLVLDRTGDSSVSVAAIPGVNFFVAERTGESRTGLERGVLFTASAEIRLVDHVKLLGELFDFAGRDWMAIAGGRLYWRGLSLDVGAMRDGGGSNEILPVGVLSYRARAL